MMILIAGEIFGDKNETGITLKYWSLIFLLFEYNKTYISLIKEL